MNCEVPTLGDFLYRVALGGFRFGYYRYAVREIPKGKDLASIDRKMMDAYGVTSCRMKRLRQRREGQASVQYVRFQQTFILMATDGTHETFAKIRSFDVRSAPLHFRSYSVGLFCDRVSVRVAKEVWGKVVAYQLARALGDLGAVEQRLYQLPFYRFPGVVAQTNGLAAAINCKRKQAGLAPISPLPFPTRHRRFSRQSYQFQS